MNDREPVGEVVIVVPANNEGRLIGECLDALIVAVSRAELEMGLSCRVVVVLDSCSDDTASVAQERGYAQLIEVNGRNVGAARGVGIARAVEASAVPPRQLWIANTDADSRVPPNWIVHQAQLANEGADIVIGSVYPDGDELGPEQLEDWFHQETADPAVLRIHGANLGVRADTYLSVGGFAPNPEHEDVMLVERAIAHGARVKHSDGCAVATSARHHGRTPGGFAGHLRDRYRREAPDDGGRR